MKFLQYFPLFVGLLHFISIALYYFHFSILASTSPFGSRGFILNNAASFFEASAWESSLSSTSWSKTYRIPETLMPRCSARFRNWRSPVRILQSVNDFA